MPEWFTRFIEDLSGRLAPFTERPQPPTMAERSAAIVADPNRPSSLPGRFAAGAEEAFPVAQILEMLDSVQDRLGGPEPQDVQQSAARAGIAALIHIV